LARSDGVPRPQLAAALEEHDGSPLDAETDLDGVAVKGGDFSGGVAPGLRIFGSALADCVLDESVLAGATLQDVTLDRVRAAGVELDTSRWLNTVVTGSLLSGAQVFNAEIRRVAFRDCKLDAVNFRDSTLVDVSFEDCSLDEADFGSATLQRVRFPGSRLTSADFTRARLEEVDLRGCQLSVGRGYDALAGAIVDSRQLGELAPALAQHLGIVVRDAG
jgi:uncharacterized protein YjbI with pentapeptide repeats